MRHSIARRMRHVSCVLAVALGAAFLAPTGASADAAADPYEVLVFSKTAGFRHDSIPVGIETIRDLGAAGEFTVTATEDSGAFTTANLADYEAVVFLSTTGDVLDGAQQTALKSYVDGGGGYVGVHAAADTEYGWPEYEGLVGAWFKSHPAIQQATIENEDRTHPATSHLDPTWTRTDEWYNYRTNPRENVRVLQSLDESTYNGGEMGDDHPITWCDEQAAGRSFYTGLGHTRESYADPAFRQVLLGGIRYAAGAVDADCSPGGGEDPGTEPTTVEGEAYTSGSGVERANHGSASGGQTLGHIENGDWAGYSQAGTAGATKFTADVSSAGAGGTVEIRSGSASGTLLGSVDIEPTGGWETFTEVSTTLTATGTGALFLRFTGGAGALFDIDRFTLSRAAEEPRAEGSSNVHLFYYPWYGNPEINGGWRHWQQGGQNPPEDVGADLYPKLGAYDSGDFTGAVEQHMEWIKQSGANVLVYSWWGRGSYEDGLVEGVMDAAQRHGIKVAWHLEPYSGRSGASTVDDINYINDNYGDHPAYFRDAERNNSNAFYVFQSLDVADWSALDQVTGNNIVLAQTTDTSKIAHFNGIYTYDGIAGATAPGWKNAGDYARANDLVWAPSVAPGYIDDRAVPGNTTPTLGRDNGAAYDKQWNNALDPSIGGSPTWVSVTSFNEWHEGSSIEPASSTPPAGHGYQTFSGAYGRTGADAETAYLDRTRHWVNQFEAARAARLR
ncbi:ThuA domain-containing protein [Streptomyces sp. NP-1717]|uniref:ThuA domain-containing protein n=1 Tax=Streptomyces sp. NP-1717 TaxID=2704470 RepID=UPI001F5CD608|nr:ThuA domain-containing protein [Streptomyces sp. NP-1717]MCI3223264.1 carbohydrate-binding protein [Streptomyces sp. NP-1717]